jgi:putative PIN family toxin of toxin-antitoxin system
MIVVVDTNVVVSSLLRAGKPRKVIATILQSDSFDWVISEAIRKEYEDVICRPKFHLHTEVIEDWFRIFSSLTRIDDSNVKAEFPRDPTDEKFLRCCLASDAKYFITGDGDFRETKRIGQTFVISCSDFLSYLESINTGN